jgi:AMP-binding enzyme
MNGPGDILHRSASRFGDKPALVTSDRTLSFAELDALSDRVAAGLLARGVESGRPVSLYSQNRWEWVVACSPPSTPPRSTRWSLPRPAPSATRREPPDIRRVRSRATVQCY